MSDPDPTETGTAILRDEEGRFAPGTPSPNPGGRPKGSSLTQTMRAMTLLSVVKLEAIEKDLDASMQERIAARAVLDAYRSSGETDKGGVGARATYTEALVRRVDPEGAGQSLDEFMRTVYVVRGPAPHAADVEAELPPEHQAPPPEGYEHLEE